MFCHVHTYTTMLGLWEQCVQHHPSPQVRHLLLLETIVSSIIATASLSWWGKLGKLAMSNACVYLPQTQGDWWPCVLCLLKIAGQEVKIDTERRINTLHESLQALSIHLVHSMFAWIFRKWNQRLRVCCCLSESQCCEYSYTHTMIIDWQTDAPSRNCLPVQP